MYPANHRPEGGPLMAQASTCGWRFRRALALTVGLLAAASFTLSAAQPPKKDDKPVEPAPGQHVKVISLPIDAPSDLVEMKGVIDKGLEEGWKANKLTPSRP